MTRIELSRSVLAEPSGVALVLAGPAAREMWPHSGDRAVIAVGGRTATSITIDPPRRAGIGFITRVVIREGATTVAAGRLTIQPAVDLPSGSDLSLVLTASEKHERALRRDGKRYLDKLARVSRDRSSAA